MNNSGHMLENNIDSSHIVSKDHDIIHEDDLDDDFKKDIGLEYESTSQATSTPKESNSPPKLRSNLDEVIESVIQDAIDYADAPQEKRILPALTRKSTKAKVKAVSVTSSSSINTFTNVASPQQQLAPINNTGLIMPTNTNPSSFHPLIQANLPQGMQHMLQLATSGKSGLSMGASNTPTSLQHTNNTTQQQQQQMASAMMGFSAAQLPNMIMPSYSTNLQSNYSQQTTGGPYQLPVSLSQIQLAQQQQPSHLLLGNNQNAFTDLSSPGGANQQNINFGTGISNTNQQLMQSSYANFGANSAISVSPYQLPGMIQAYTQPTVTDNGSSNPISQNNDSAINLNTNPSNASCFHSSKPSSNHNNSNSSNNALTMNSVSSNQNISTVSVAASLYQNQNPFDLQQQTQLYAHQRLLQAQQHQQNSTTGLFPDYAAVMARYGAYH